MQGDTTQHEQSRVVMRYQSNAHDILFTPSKAGPSLRKKAGERRSPAFAFRSG
jgi:hypothetical protein